ncbi:acyl carrier protein [candidate division KSB1 bacterium]|nr:acyl carrier protein [candidate division KSB1 bacterium]
MKRDEIAQRVIDVTARELELNKDQIKHENHFAFDLGADSLKSIELVAAFEEEFDLDLNEEEALKVQTVGGAIDFFDNILNKD